MNKRKLSLIISVFLLCAMLLFSSCQLSKLIDKGDTTKANQETSETTANSVTEEQIKEEHPSYDFSAVTDYSAIVTLGEFIGREVSYEDINVSEEEYLKYIESLLLARGYHDEITDRNTLKGDVVDISYKGYIDNELFEGGSAEHQKLTLDETSGYIDGFADGLIDKDVGVVIKLNLKFPDDYHASEYAGKEVMFDVTINFIYQAKELTDEIVVEIMTDYEDYTTVEKFHEFFRKATADTKRSNAISVMWKDLMAECVIIDETIYSQQSDHYFYMMYEYYQQAATYYGMSLDDLLMNYGIAGEDGLMEIAMDYAKFDIVFNAIIHTQELEIDDAEYLILLAEYADEMGITVSEMEQDYSKDDIKNFLLERLMYDEMFANCVITGMPQ